MIFVKNLKSVSDQEWSTTDKYPGVRWKFLIDADFTESSGLSLGMAEIAPGGDSILHYHSPAEIYVVTDGRGILNKSGKLEEIKKGDVVYISENTKHALKNDGSVIRNGSETNSVTPTIATGDIAMIAYDADNGAFYAGRNGTWGTVGGYVGVPTSGSSKTGAISLRK